MNAKIYAWNATSTYANSPMDKWRPAWIRAAEMKEKREKEIKDECI